MATLEWTSELVLKQAQMDSTHVEFVAHLAALEHSLGAAGADEALHTANVDLALADLVTHTVAHFAQEEAWMVQLGFSSENCHAYQHRHVLQVMHEVQRLWLAERDAGLVGQLVTELAQWFPLHARTMDAGLAQTMAERGLDPDAGTLAQPLAEGSAALTGCGSTACNEG